METTIIYWGYIAACCCWEGGCKMLFEHGFGPSFSVVYRDYIGVIQG